MIYEGYLLIRVSESLVKRVRLNEHTDSDSFTLVTLRKPLAKRSSVSVSDRWRSQRAKAAYLNTHGFVDVFMLKPSTGTETRYALKEVFVLVPCWSYVVESGLSLVHYELKKWIKDKQMEQINKEHFSLFSLCKVAAKSRNFSKTITLSSESEHSASACSESTLK